MIKLIKKIIVNIKYFFIVKKIERTDKRLKKLQFEMWLKRMKELNNYDSCIGNGIEKPKQ